MSGIKDIQGFVEEAERIALAFDKGLSSTTHPWFRGHGDAAWRLVPGLYRGRARPELEREMLRDFKLRANAFLERQPHDDFEWLFVMQHYGIPTRLLDWTESYLAALFFAVTQYDHEADACVWVLHPWSLNTLVLEQESVPTSAHPALEEWVLDGDPVRLSRTIAAKLPVAVRPTRSTARIVAQRGMFTVHGSDARPLDALFNLGTARGEVKLRRIEIDGPSKREIARRLLLAGISDSVLFPELPGLSREIGFRYSKDYRDPDGR